MWGGGGGGEVGGGGGGGGAGGTSYPKTPPSTPHRIMTRMAKQMRIMIFFCKRQAQQEGVTLTASLVPFLS